MTLAGGWKTLFDFRNFPWFENLAVAFACIRARAFQMRCTAPFNGKAAAKAVS
jgi:hypothetical protein